MRPDEPVKPARRMSLIVCLAYLERGDHNVLAADWRQIAGKRYPVVVSNAESVGAALAQAIDELAEEGLPQESLHVVGHSMGAQVAGYASRQTSFELRRVTGEWDARLSVVS